MLSFHKLLELLAPEVLASVNEKSTQRLLEWLVRPTQLINANWCQKPFHTASMGAITDAINLLVIHVEIERTPVCHDSNQIGLI